MKKVNEKVTACLFYSEIDGGALLGLGIIELKKAIVYMNDEAGEIVTISNDHLTFDYNKMVRIEISKKGFEKLFAFLGREKEKETIRIVKYKLILMAYLFNFELHPIFKLDE